LLLIVLDPAMARATGIQVNRWENLSSIWLGLCIGLSIHVGGVLFGFGCLVLPALIAKHFSTEIRQIFWKAPLIAFSMTLFGLVLGHYFDFPPGQFVVGLLALGVILTWTFTLIPNLAKHLNPLK
jgi:ABC-type Mn2+/Zn2+ transport system permease subunit